MSNLDNKILYVFEEIEKAFNVKLFVKVLSPEIAFKAKVKLPNCMIYYIDFILDRRFLEAECPDTITDYIKCRIRYQWEDALRRNN